MDNKEELEKKKLELRKKLYKEFHSLLVKSPVVARSTFGYTSGKGVVNACEHLWHKKEDQLSEQDCNTLASVILPSIKAQLYKAGHGDEIAIRELRLLGIQESLYEGSGIELSIVSNVSDFGRYLVTYDVKFPNGSVWRYVVPFTSKEVWKLWHKKSHFTPGKAANYLKQNAIDKEQLQKTSNPLKSSSSSYIENVLSSQSNVLKVVDILTQ